MGARERTETNVFVKRTKVTKVTEIVINHCIFIRDIVYRGTMETALI